MSLRLFFVSLISLLILNCIQAQEANTKTVYLFVLDDCKICQYYAPQLDSMKTKYASDSLQFRMIFPNFSSKPKAINRFKNKYGISIEHQTDYYKTLTNKFEVNVLPTVVVYDDMKETIIYKGRIDNAYFSLGRKRRVVNTHELQDVLTDLHLGISKQYANTESVGCFINFNDQLSK